MNEFSGQRHHDLFGTTLAFVCWGCYFEMKKTEKKGPAKGEEIQVSKYV